jgi:hypothetical protein
LAWFDEKKNQGAELIDQLIFVVLYVASSSVTGEVLSQALEELPLSTFMAPEAKAHQGTDRLAGTHVDRLGVPFDFVGDRRGKPYAISRTCLGCPARRDFATDGAPAAPLA